jgi:hypothetical protein
MKKVRLILGIDIYIPLTRHDEKAVFVFPAGHTCEVLAEIEDNKCVVKIEKIYHTLGYEVVLVSFNRTLKLGEECEFI